MRKGRLLALFALILAAIGLATPAAAHEFLPSLLDLRDLGGGRYELAFRPAPSSGEGASPGAALGLVFPAACVRLDGPSLPPSPAGLLDCGPAGLRGQPIGVDGLSGGAEVVVRFTPRTGPIVTAVLREGSPRMVIPDPDVPGGPRFSTRLALARTYLVAGIEHILGGADHLLFVLGLLLLVRRSEAAFPPAERRTGSTVVRTVTAFTLAHSVTLGLSVLGVVELSPPPVEAAIALSIFFVALELAREGAAPPRGRAGKAAFAFGLLHGFGFAGALRSLGLPAGQAPLSLLSFNLGVELGQLAFVVVALGALALLGRPIARAPAFARRAPAYVLGSFAALLGLERIADFWS
ncbi:MAG: HupE/UreJ family protein [Byssovorax sp.]